MTDAEKREAARQFYNKWVNRGKEDEDDRSYWIDFLQKILGADDVTDRIEFQKKVVADGNTKRIDAYIPETRVLIEQKSLNIPLDKPQQGHDGKTPYEQAKMYDNALPVSEKAKWIIISNFAEIWVYDMDTRVPEPVKFTLSEIPTKYSQFEFLVNQQQHKLSQEMAISEQAGDIIGKIYDALYKQYINPNNEESLKSLNMLCVRIVFCLYAEDAHIFGSSGNMFHDYLEQFEAKDMRKALIELFKILDTPEENRDPYDTSDLSKFPFVNGGLFEKEDIEIPNFTDEIRNVLLSKASEGFDWSQISPTIFGALFESTLNPETRRSGGMHYTSIENIHKVIDPLFLEDLTNEYKSISEIKVEKNKKAKLESYQKKLATLTWLDPACGSGNFLTETYISIRRLENQVIRDILDCDRKQVDGQIVFGDVINPIKVSISQFYGIEINDFAVTVAKTALWIAESQMMQETEDILAMSLDFLPLKTNACIHEGNALQINWEEVVPIESLSYIMGNPPFVGSKKRNNEQREDVKRVLAGWDNAGNLDYVACWYKKAADIVRNTRIKAAFVSTNSITQGEEVAALWKPLLTSGIDIDFAHRTFRWDSEANSKAQVHCVIVGICAHNNLPKRIYKDSEYEIASNINGYLINGENIFLERRTKPLCDAPEIIMGPMSLSGNTLILEKEEKEELLAKEPAAEKWVRRFSMGKEFIDGEERYCLWLKGISPAELNSLPEVLKHVKACKEYRENSVKTGDAYKYKDSPHLFRPSAKFDENCSYFAMPQTSTENRRYIPMDFVTSGMIPGQKLYIIPNGSLYLFGIMMSNVHMAWTRAVCGRMKSDYSYSIFIVYNNFPWPKPTEEQRKKIEETAQGILDARALYPDSSLADLYGIYSMPLELQNAHHRNNAAVMNAYGFSVKDTSEEACVKALMKLYQELTK